MKKKTGSLGLVLACAMLLPACGNGDTGDSENSANVAAELQEVSLTVCTAGNPVVGDVGDGTYIYGGDPSALVDGDTVYLYTGHDTAVREEYVIPEYLCYSSTDLVNWKEEGVVMKADKATVSWANTNTSAWAAQVAKHYDAAAGKDKYYLYFCTWDATSNGRQSIGVAVSGSPTGPFVDIGQPLVKGTVTEPQSSDWNDIDPTVWIETDADGVEHRYLAWGNGNYYICELNEDMISVRDRNGDGQITCGSGGDIVQKAVGSYTEAPWLYRRQDGDGNYYGDYYLFYASGWREGMTYATTDDLFEGTWMYGDVIGTPSATSNTNHMAVIDFKGKTYFVYHNGALPGGSGFRRSACIRELVFNADGSIDPFEETASGVSGKADRITLLEGGGLSHEHFNNSATDDAYPYTKVAVGIYENAKEPDSLWVIRPGKADRSNKAYVSVESENKQGLFLTANEDGSVTLAQENKVDTDVESRQTFRTVKGLADEAGVSFESVSQPGKFLTVKDRVLILSDGSDKANATFSVTQK